MDRIDYDHRAEDENPSLASDNPSPFSSALHIPTLVEDPAQDHDSRPHPDDPAPFSSLLGLPVLLRRNASGATRSSNQSRCPADADATPLGERRFASKLSVDPSAHLAGVSRLDLAAALVAAIMTLGPLFAAFVDRIE